MIDWEPFEKEARELDLNDELAKYRRDMAA